MVDICSEHSYSELCNAQHCTIGLRSNYPHEEEIYLATTKNGLSYRVHKRLSTHKRIKTQRELADYLKMDASKLSRILSNPRRKLTQDQFDKMLNFLECSADELEITLENDALPEQDLLAKHATLEAIAREQSLQIRELAQRMDDTNSLLEKLQRQQRWEESEHGHKSSRSS